MVEINERDSATFPILLQTFEITSIVYLIAVIIVLYLWWTTEITDTYVEYCIIKQIDRDNEIVIKFPPYEDLQFIIEGDNLSAITELQLAISAVDGDMIFMSKSFKLKDHRIIIDPFFISDRMYEESKSWEDRNNVLPISLLWRSPEYVMKLSYKTEKGNLIKGTMSLRGRMKWRNYSKDFSPFGSKVKEKTLEGTKKWQLKIQ